MTYTIMHRDPNTSKVGRGHFDYKTKEYAEEIKKKIKKIYPEKMHF